MLCSWKYDSEMSIFLKEYKSFAIAFKGWLDKAVSTYGWIGMV